MTGHCPDGCKPHWNGTKCDGKKKTLQYKKILLLFTRMWLIKGKILYISNVRTLFVYSLFNLSCAKNFLILFE